MKQQLILIASLVAGLVAFILSQRYLQNEKALFTARFQRVEVVVAARALPADTTLTREDIGSMKKVKAELSGRAIMPDEWEAIIGKKLNFAHDQGEPILWSSVDMPTRRGSGLSTIIMRDDLRAISISCAGDAAVSGLVRPDDHVDVLGTFSLPSEKIPGEMETVTLTVLQDVRILATGQQMAKQLASSDQRRSTGYNTVTLEVTPRESELLVFAQAIRGKLVLSLRRDGSLHYEPMLPNVNFDHIQEKLGDYNEHRQTDIHRKKPRKSE